MSSKPKRFYDESISIFPNNPSKEIVHSFISEAAYYKAKKRGESGHEEQDWAEAERDIESCLKGYFDLAFLVTTNGELIIRHPNYWHY